MVSSCLKLAGAALIASFCTVGAYAQEERSLSGWFERRMLPCQLAQYKGGPACEAPKLPENSDVSMQSAARKERAYFFADLYRFPEAQAEAEEALKLDQNDAEIHHILARLAMSTGNHLRTEGELKLALRLKPDDPDIRATRGQFLEQRKAEREAIEEYTQVLALQPSNRFSRLARARLHLERGENGAAVHDLDLLLQEKHDPNLFVLRGSAHLAAGEGQKALDDINESLKPDPTVYSYIVSRANVLVFLGNDEAALQDLDLLLGSVGGRPRYALVDPVGLRLQRAFVLGRLKRYADAAVDALDAIRAGGNKAVLRAQIILRQNGFPETPLDGKDSEALKTSLQACFGLNSCFVKLSEKL